MNVKKYKKNFQLAAALVEGSGRDTILLYSNYRTILWNYIASEAQYYDMDLNITPGVRDYDCRHYVFFILA